MRDVPPMLVLPSQDLAGVCGTESTVAQESSWQGLEEGGRKRGGGERRKKKGERRKERGEERGNERGERGEERREGRGEEGRGGVISKTQLAKC